MFPVPSVHAAVVQELESYTEGTETQTQRVRLAILRLCKGNADTLRELVVGANEDFQDIIALAETPNMMKAEMENRKLNLIESKKAEEKDWEQYHSWIAEGMK